MYALTKRDAEGVAEFLIANGVAALAYTGEQESDDRIATEERLLRNEVKAVVATSALGMGYDKADLTFVMHYRAPGSVVSYYQQVGRAAAALSTRTSCCSAAARTSASRTSSWSGLPDSERVNAVLGELGMAGGEGRTTRQLMAAVNLGIGRIEAMLKSSTWRARCGRTPPAGSSCPARAGATTASATDRSPPCAGPNRRRWRHSDPTAAV